MPRRLPLALALPAAAIVLGATALPALAYPTTPTPPPKHPGQPPISQQNGPQPLGHAVGDAGAGLAVLRLLPQSITEQTILKGAGEQAPEQALGELGFGLSSAQANSESLLKYEHSVAESAPMGIAFKGNSPKLPGALAQTAPPDNANPVSGGLEAPKNPLINIGLLKGKVHARWSDKLGPCVGTISDASTSVADLSLLNVIPTMSGATNLTKVLSPSAQQAEAKSSGDKKSSLPAPLNQLGGLLKGLGNSATGGLGSLVSLPNTLSSRSVVKLVDIPGSDNKAVQSTSTLQAADLKILAKTPFETSIKVVSQPTLQVTSTGDPDTSSVKYTAPVLEVDQNGKTLGKLDAAHPTANLPLQLVPTSLLPDQLTKFFPDAKNLESVPVLGSLAALMPDKADEAKGISIPLGVIRISIAQEKHDGKSLTKGKDGAPFTGYQLGATARMLDIQLLPTDALNLDNVDIPGLDSKPSALAEVALGEQVARAYAPKGGVVCGTKEGAAPPAKPKPQGSPPLAYTDAAYHAVPMFWAGTGSLLAGVVLVAAIPSRRRKRGQH